MPAKRKTQPVFELRFGGRCGRLVDGLKIKPFKFKQIKRKN